MKWVINMNELVYIGYIVGTHGIKGEIKIISDFEHKDKVFKSGFIIYINKEEFIINSYRPHQQYDMITLKGINNINEVLKYKGKDVFVKRSALNLKENEYLLNDLIGMKVMEAKKELGKVEKIVYNNNHNLMEVLGEKRFYIPIHNNFIKSVNVATKEIEVENAEGLMI